MIKKPPRKFRGKFMGSTDQDSLNGIFIIHTVAVQDSLYTKFWVIYLYTRGGLGLIKQNPSKLSSSYYLYSIYIYIYIFLGYVSQ